MRNRKRAIIIGLASGLLVASCASESTPGDVNSLSSQGELGSSSTEQADQNASVAPPTTEICPHHVEVSEAPDAEQFEVALDLGCDYGVYGEIVFAEPVRIDGNDYTDTLTDPSRALSSDEMREMGYTDY